MHQLHQGVADRHSGNTELGGNVYIDELLARRQFAMLYGQTDLLIDLGTQIAIANPFELYRFRHPRLPMRRFRISFEAGVLAVIRWNCSYISIEFDLQTTFQCEVEHRLDRLARCFKFIMYTV
ncbi:hypothetical protein NKJ13_03765 [Mesorhizobium sp. M0174]|uniref:hypothetical protein n=1 Tax=Mesorhizobium sp. M0174 TaxID=2956904 RepID=UPI00333B5FE2